MIINNKIELNGVSLELTKKTNKNGVSYLACEMVFPNGSRKQIGFALDFYVIRKIIKGGNLN